MLPELADLPALLFAGAYRSRVYIDPYTGEVLMKDGAREARIAMLVASISIVLEAITGSIIWIARTFKNKRVGEPVPVGQVVSVS